MFAPPFFFFSLTFYPFFLRGGEYAIVLGKEQKRHAAVETSKTVVANSGSNSIRYFKL